MEMTDILSQVDAATGEGLILKDLHESNTSSEEDQAKQQDDSCREKEVTTDGSLTTKDVAFLLDFEGEGLCFGLVHSSGISTGK